MSYRDDAASRAARADALIHEIGDLERQKVGRSELDQRLDDARRELMFLQAPPAPPPAPRGPGVATHVMVFVAAAACTFTGYTLFF